MTQRILTVVGAALALLLWRPAVAHADLPPGALTVSGDVRNVLTLSADALRAFPSRTEVVTFRAHAGPESHVYHGAALDAILTAAQPLHDEAVEQSLITLAVVATGADGYAATLSWADASPAVVARPALVAWMQDGAVLDRPRLVVPGDRAGARQVRDLTVLRVVRLAAT